MEEGPPSGEAASEASPQNAAAVGGSAAQHVDNMPPHAGGMPAQCAADVAQHATDVAQHATDVAQQVDVLAQEQQHDTARFNATAFGQQTVSAPVSAPPAVLFPN